MAMKDALACVELMGLPTAIAFADTAVKSANVELVGYELSKGAGLVTVKLIGNVSSVKAAVEAASITANQVGRVVGIALFPRPSDGIEHIVYNDETVGLVKPKLEEAKPEDEDVKPDDETAPIMEDAVSTEVVMEQEALLSQDETAYTCNLCKDPACKRKFGENKKACIHHASQS